MVDTVEIDESIEGIYATQFFGWLVAMTDQLINATVDNAVEFQETILG